MKLTNYDLLSGTGQQANSNSTSLLEHCQACGNKVSKHAATCPACGHPQYMPASQIHTKAQRVSVTDIDIPFGSMVGFMVKWALAAIPALIIIIIIGTVLISLFAGFFGHGSNLPSV